MTCPSCHPSCHLCHCLGYRPSGLPLLHLCLPTRPSHPSRNLPTTSGFLCFSLLSCPWWDGLGLLSAAPSSLGPNRPNHQPRPSHPPTNLLPTTRIPNPGWQQLCLYPWLYPALFWTCPGLRGRQPLPLL